MINHNVYKAPDGVTFTLINDDIVVRMGKLREKTKGGIHIPDTVGDRGDAGLLTTGTIEAFGFKKIGGKKGKPFKKIPLPDYYVGMKVVFVRFYAEQHTNKAMQYIFGDGVIRMKPSDILFAYDAEDEDRVLQ